MLSPRLLPLVEGCGIVERGDNRSRHCPIWLKLNIGSLPLRKPTSRWVPKRPAWSKASFDHVQAYKEHLGVKLAAIEELYDIPNLICDKVHCQNKTHDDIRDDYLLDILSAIIESSHATLPSYGGCWVGENRPGVNIPGWTTDVKPFRDKWLYWGNIWRQAGRPVIGWLHDIYVKVRKEYHLAVLRAKRRRQEYQAEGLLIAALEGDISLMKEMKIIKKGYNNAVTELPEHVSGAYGEANIAEVFKESYENLYNSAPSTDEMNELSELIKSTELS